MIWRHKPSLTALTRLAALVISLQLAWACEPAEKPTNVHIVYLRGDPYQRGFEHGKQLSAHIRSLYTKLLASSILPFLNREQLNITPVLPVYAQPEYTDGRFSFKMLLESGEHLLEHYLPEDYRREMEGIADGSGMDFDQVLVLNTFFDTMLGFRSIVAFIQLIQQPYIDSFSLLDGPAADGRDNDGDSETDEEGEGQFEPYRSLPHGILVEVPADVRIRLVIKDLNLSGLACVDPRNIEPLTEIQFSKSCVNPSCLRPACRDQALVGRDCIRESALTCIDPRVDAECLDHGCVEPTDPGCVDPDSIRITLNDQLYVVADDAVQTRLLPPEDEEPPGSFADCYGPLEVVITPPGGLEPASIVSLVVQAGDQSPVYSPPPFHSKVMRDERIVFTTEGFAAQAGYGARPHEVENRGEWDPRSQPPSIAFGVRGSATEDGNPLFAHHYTLLDSDMVHEHSVVFVYIPDEGHPHVVPSWAGLIWGFSGMNDQGLTYAFNNSDSLDNSLVGGVLKTIFEPENLAKLVQNPDLKGLSAALSGTSLFTTGLLAGITGREVLTRTATVEEGIGYMYSVGRTYGWNYMLADAEGEMAVLELDSGTQALDPGQGAAPMDEDGFRFYSPDPSDPANLDQYGRPFASTGPDDLRMASHFQKNQDDMVDLPILSTFAPRPQRFWSGFYFRSLRAFYILGEQISSRYGTIDLNQAIEILRTPDLVDTRDSMNACVYEPATRKLHWAMGGVPATDQPFVEFDLGLETGGGQ